MRRHAPGSSTVPLVATLGLGVLLVGCGGYRSPGSATGAAETAVGRDTLTCTIRNVEPGRRLLEVLTGRGFAIEALTFRVPEDVPILWRGEEVPLTAMVPGYIVRIEYRETVSGLVAERIEETEDVPSDPPPESPAPESRSS